jgi:ATP-dependent RNA helicase SUPV3L1/SUV3
MNEFNASASFRPVSSRNVIAVLGPTNTGKTHLAIERMIGHQSGLIGLPLRLLAREVYDKVVAKVGARDVALITGEEKIKPDNPRFYVCTVEAMPRDVEVDFLAVDEIQLAADPERGHVFTERLLYARGASETLLLGAATMQETIRELIPGANFISRPRLSKLTYGGQKKITRLPRRTAVVAFSAADVYAIAELIRRQRGGAAVVLGALSPRTRNAQVALYQSGEVDFLVATDAIGMGLNLDVDHVAFAGVSKFDGKQHRLLTPGELGQISGRAGRHVNDGSFGVTGDVEPFAADIVARLENHEFEPIKVLQWRSSALDFDSLERLKDSLRQSPNHARLTRARLSDDMIALDNVCLDPEIFDIARSPAAVRRLWEVCQIPDYRKISATNHAELAAAVYKYLMSDEGVIPEDWFASQVAFSDRTDGDIDTLATRIAHIRTWTFVSHRRDWLANHSYWQERTREIEDNLSDALHERLTQRFVDRRTSILMKSLRDKDMLYADIENDGSIFVEKHFVGKLEGFRFTPDASATGVHGKAARSAAAKVLALELSQRAQRLSEAKDEAVSLSRTGQILWQGQEVGRLEAGDDPLKPGFVLFTDEHLAAPDKERIAKRIETWLTQHIEMRIKPLLDVSGAGDITGLARGVAFRLKENFGILRREEVAEEIRSLDQEARAELRKYGVRFGAYNIYFPMLLKPAAADLLLLLWSLKAGPGVGVETSQLPEPPRQGLTSAPVEPELAEAFYRAAGFHICGGRAVRIDMLERLADRIRPLIAWKPTEAQPEAPPGAAGGGAFRLLPEMMSIMGCSAEELGNILQSLGYRKERRLVKKTFAAKPVQVPEPAQVAEPVDGVDMAPADAAIPVDGGEPPHAAGGGEAAVAQTAVVVEAGAEAPEPAAAPVSESQAQPDAEAAAEAQEEYEEIWRVRRKSWQEVHGGAAREGQRGRGQDRRQNRDGGGRSDRRNGVRPAVGKNESDGAQQREQAQQDGQNPVQGRPQGDSRHNAQRSGQRNAPQQGQAGRDAGRDARRGGRPNDRANEQGGGKGRRQDSRHGGDRQQYNRGPRTVVSAPPPRKASETAINPDSPFAALRQLKEKLERQAQDQA